MDAAEVWLRIQKVFPYAAVAGAAAAITLASQPGWRHAVPLGGGASVAATAPQAAVEADVGLKFSTLAPRGSPLSVAPDDAAEAAWLFGALVSGGRSDEAWAMLSPQAQRDTSAERFDAQLGSAYLLRGSDDAPWRVPGSNVFLFNLSDREQPAALKGQLRVGLDRIDGHWRVAAFSLREADRKR